MPHQKLALEPGGPKRLELSWGWEWKKLDVRVDDTLLGTFADKTQLLAGQTFSLDDGSSLHVRLVKTFWYPTLQVVRNDQPLPGMLSNAARRRLGVVYLVILLLFGGGTLAIRSFVIPQVKEYLKQLVPKEQPKEETPTDKNDQLAPPPESSPPASVLLSRRAKYG